MNDTKQSEGQFDERVAEAKVRTFRLANGDSLELFEHTEGGGQAIIAYKATPISTALMNSMHATRATMGQHGPLPWSWIERANLIGKFAGIALEAMRTLAGDALEAGFGPMDLPLMNAVVSAIMLADLRSAIESSAADMRKAETPAAEVDTHIGALLLGVLAHSREGANVGAAAWQVEQKMKAGEATSSHDGDHQTVVIPSTTAEDDATLRAQMSAFLGKTPVGQA